MNKYELQSHKQITTMRPQAISFIQPGPKREPTQSNLGKNWNNIVQKVNGSDARVTHESLASELGKAQEF